MIFTEFCCGSWFNKLFLFKILWFSMTAYISYIYIIWCNHMWCCFYPKIDFKYFHKNNDFSGIILKRLGSNAFDCMSQYRLNAWLSHQEDSHRIVFFVCDNKRASAWNRLCIRQADCILVLALGNSDGFKPTPMEMALKNDPTKVIF